LVLNDDNLLWFYRNNEMGIGKPGRICSIRQKHNHATNASCHCTIFRNIIQFYLCCVAGWVDVQKTFDGKKLKSMKQALDNLPNRVYLSSGLLNKMTNEKEVFLCVGHFCLLHCKLLQKLLLPI